jgi:hypothetical protein
VEILKTITIVLIFLLPFRYAIERVKPFNQVDLDDTWKKSLVHWANANEGKKVQFGYPDPVEAMFYTDAMVYLVVPELEVMKDIQAKGYQVFVQSGVNSARAEQYSIHGIKAVDIATKPR